MMKSVQEILQARNIYVCLIITMLCGSVLFSSLPNALAANTLYVKAIAPDGKSLSMWVVVQNSAGNTVKTGFTPLTFAGTVGQTYKVIPADYNGIVFDHWGSGSTVRARTFTMTTSNVWFDAYYRTGSVTLPPPPPPDDDNTNPMVKLLPKTGVFVALYMYPSGTGWTHWQKVIDAKLAHPSVPIVVAINPSSGPGSYRDTNFVNGINKLHNAGIIVLGYTYDNYGTRSLSNLRADVDKYRNWYNADGVFIDEFTNKLGFENHYREVTAYAKSVGMVMTMGNPGTDVPRSYIGTVDVINITEGVGYAPMSWLQFCVLCTTTGWHDDYDKRNFAYIRYDIDWLDTNYVIESSNWVGLLYIHSGDDSNHRWFNVPSYLMEEVAALDR